MVAVSIEPPHQLAAVCVGYSLADLAKAIDAAERRR
jgi:hypothetical protein